MLGGGFRVYLQVEAVMSLARSVHGSLGIKLVSKFYLADPADIIA